MQKKDKGFTLIELLAIVLIVGIVIGVVGYSTMKVINNSKDKSYELALDNIKTSARVYAEENIDNIIWINKDEKFYSCINIKTLVDAGLLTNGITDKSNININNNIIITKDLHGNITSEALDEETNSVCQINNNIVKIPTQNDCNDISYNGNEQKLTNFNSNQLITVLSNKGRDAGEYNVTFKLSNPNNYIWSDGTKDDKTISCRIKKAIPTLDLNPNGSDGTIGELLTPTLSSNIPGTVKIKSSNKEYATATIINTNDANNKWNIEIQSLSTRKNDAKTIITFTFIPDATNSNNYHSSSTTYTIDKINRKKVTIPVCSENLFYNGSEKTMIKLPENEEVGYNLFNYKATNIGNYTITAKLKYGYIWNDNTIESKEISCEIKTPKILITFKANGSGAIVSPSSKTVTYNSIYGSLPTPTRTGYTFNGWYTATSGGTKIENTTTVTTLNDQTLYAHWTANTYNITFNTNGSGATVSPSSKTVTYNSTYGSLPTPTRTGYTFNGWYTATSGGTKIESTTTVTILNNQTLYAHWKPNGITFTYTRIATDTIAYTVTGTGIDSVCKIHNDNTYGTTYTYVNNGEFKKAYDHMDKKNKCFFYNDSCKYGAGYTAKLNSSGFTCASKYTTYYMSICAKTTDNKYACIKYNIENLALNATNTQTATPK